jgi:hypothetical protein
MHAWQAVTPPHENVPAGHAEQFPLASLAEYVPGRQSLQTLAPACVKNPLGHVRHAVACPVGAYWPIRQATHTRLCSYVPGGHAMHWLGEEAARTRLYVPARQALQSRTVPAFQKSRYVWSGQSWHTLALAGANLPSWHAVHDSAPSPETVPSPQVEHAVTPLKAYWPASHGTHSRFSSYFPVAQPRHAKTDGIPAYGAVVPAGQALQSCTPPAYGRSRYVWNGQSWHALAPTGAYLPSAHDEHVPIPSHIATVPFPHRSHTRAPAVLAGKEYVPARHQSQKVGRPV